MKSPKNRLLIVCPYPLDEAPSQRFRFGQYIKVWEEAGWKVDVRPFWTRRAWKHMYAPGRTGLKFRATLWGFLSRFFLLFSLGRYGLVFIHREATPVGPPWWEWAAARVFRKKLVYDFDDAIWLPNNSEANAGLVGKWKWHGKVNRILGWSDVVFAGNDFLADHAGRFAGDVRVVPTTIDTDYHIRSATGKTEGGNGELILGWTGSHSTLKQLTPLFPVLDALWKRQRFRLVIIADRRPEVMPAWAVFRKWKRETEIEDLSDIDIGLMPLFDTEWERGKCGFKALQYMALGIPAVVSAVGANTVIVRDGVDGFWAEPMPADAGPLWKERLDTLLSDANLRETMGKAGRRRVEAHYSVNAFKAEYLRLIDG